MNVQIIKVQRAKAMPLTPAQLEAFEPENLAESVRIIEEANFMLGIETVPMDSQDNQCSQDSQK